MSNKDIRIIRSNRNSISLEIGIEGSAVLRIPKRLSNREVIKFLKKHESWIIKRKKEMKNDLKKLNLVNFEVSKIDEYKRDAIKLFSSRLEFYSKFSGIRYKKFRLSNAKKRWGSCSSKQTISINWRLFFAPRDVQEYVIVHELLHLKQMNHSKIYWKEVEKIIPDYKKHKTWLKENSHLLNLGSNVTN